MAPDFSTVVQDDFTVESTDSAESMRAALEMPAETVPAPAPSEEPEPDPEPEPEPEAATAEAKPARVTKKDWQARVDKLTWQRGQVERERDALKAELEAARAAVQSKRDEPKAATTFPTWEKWSADHPDQGYESYLDERADHRAEMKAEAKVAEALAKREAQDQERRATEKSQTVVERLDTLGRGAFADFREKFEELTEQGLQFSPTIAGIVAEELDGETPLGHKLAYHLATHPDDLRRLNALQPLTAARQIQKILDTLAPASRGSEAPAPVSQAKPPVRPIGGSPAAVSVDDPGDDEDVDKYIARMNAKDRKAGRL
jgi:hypothetical protein